MMMHELRVYTRTCMCSWPTRPPSCLVTSASDVLAGLQRSLPQPSQSIWHMTKQYVLGI